MRSTAKRKTAPALTRERIAEAALAHIDAHGRTALSMRSLAADLGYEAMSLYHHVDGIEGVLDLVVDRLLASVIARKPASDPRQTLQRFAKAYLALAETHPEAFPLIAMRLWRTQAAIATAGTAVALLRELGQTPRTALRNARIMGAYLNGAGLALAAWRTNDPNTTARAAASNAQMATTTGDVNATNVRADIDAGLVQILDTITA